MKSFKENFQNVPALNTPGYFWFINFEMDQEELLAQVHDMYDRGLRNICLHPVPQGWRPKTYLRTEMSPEYLTEDYFKIIQRLVDECRKLGMHYYLYDEGGWPSGGACGQVLANHPDWKRRWVTKDENGGIKIIEEPYSDFKAMLPDLLQPGATEEFIALTHEQHLKYLGDHIGSTVKVAFMDEPAIATCSANRLTWTPDFAEEFKRRKGYDIVPRLPELIGPATMEDSGELVDMRIDFHEVRTQLFIERFLLPIRDWCRKNNMLSGGHFDGEDTPEKSTFRTYGSILKSLRYLDVPGIDVIWRQIWPELSEPAFPRFASSVANQQNNTYSIGEIYGVYGNGMTPHMLRYIIDYIFAHGINLLVYGSYPQRNAKNWTAGCRPHFGPDDPMWKYFDEFHAYAGRASYLLSCGKPLRTSALVFDTRSLWADNYENPTVEYWRKQTEKRLRERGVLFDYIDEDVIAEGHIEGKTLVAGAMRYEELLLPKTRRLSAAAEEQIAAFIAAGGKVVESADDAIGFNGIKPLYPKLWLEARQLDEKCTLWFFFNSGREEIEPAITLPGAENVVLADPLTGKFYNAKRSADGSIRYPFGSYDTVFFITGMTADEDLPETPCFENSKVISGNWTLKPLVRHFVGKDSLKVEKCSSNALLASPGDWRNILGEDFSGDAMYSIDFIWNGDVPGNARLDLGKVNYCCSVVLNGKEFGKRFRGPFTFDISGVLKSGENHLEIVVSNSLANAYSPREVELAMQENWPPRSGYEDRQRSYERDSLSSGLFGPVTVKY